MTSWNIPFVSCTPAVNPPEKIIFHVEILALFVSLITVTSFQSAGLDDKSTLSTTPFLKISGDT